MVCSSAVPPASGACRSDRHCGHGATHRSCHGGSCNCNRLLHETRHGRGLHLLARVEARLQADIGLTLHRLKRRALRILLHDLGCHFLAGGGQVDSDSLGDAGDGLAHSWDLDDLLNGLDVRHLDDLLDGLDLGDLDLLDDRDVNDLLDGLNHGDLHRLLDLRDGRHLSLLLHGDVDRIVDEGDLRHLDHLLNLGDNRDLDMLGDRDLLTSVADELDLGHVNGLLDLLDDRHLHMLLHRNVDHLVDELDLGDLHDLRSRDGRNPD
mmetsp:Transcript_21854/g.47627  ORF Transcript_21854/g.47627 Transcript_21854/m.47627 type:complete len:265 (+) Transcript_21854:101-895(+)